MQYLNEGFQEPHERKRGLQFEVAARSQRPDRNNALYTFQYMYDLAKGLVEADPSAQHVAIGLSSRRESHQPGWDLRCIAHRSNTSDPARGASMLMLMLVTALENVYVGGHTKPQRLHMSFSLYMRPRSDQLLTADGDESSLTRAFVGVDQITFASFAKSFFHGLQENLENRQYVSRISSVEAAVFYLEKSFGQSPLSQFFAIQNIKLRIDAKHASGTTLARYYQREHSTKPLRADDATERDTKAKSFEHLPHHVELAHDVTTGSSTTSIQLEVCKSLLVRFNEAQRDKCPVEVKYATLGVAPIDTTSSLPQASSSKPAWSEKEISNLVASVSDVLEKVCDGVRFDDITKVPQLLSEAVLRVVRPPTASLKLERVSLGVLIGDDPLVLTETVSLGSMEAARRATDTAILPTWQYQLPPNTTSKVIADTKFRHA